jgi:protein-S-isoprenylcysteine O-methyltransferase
MRLPSLEILCLVIVASELSLALFKRAGRATGRDRLTLPLLWLVISASMWLAFYCRARFPEARVPAPLTFYLVGLILFVIGLIIRWIAIIHLGRFFTVNVAIAQDHKLITNGPYRYVRHPSYTGAFLIFLGLAFCLLNFYSMAAVLIPICIAFLWRIHVEESALRLTFGDQYGAYASRTPRILPFLW